MLGNRALGLVIATSCLAVACSAADGGPPRERTGSSEGPLAAAFTIAAADAGVPRDLLVAIAKVEEGLDIPRTREVDADNEVPAAGPLQLRRGKLDTLARGAALVGATELELRVDADLALYAGARVLSELANKTGARPGDLASYRAAIEELSGFADDAHREAYAHQVFAALARGGELDARDGERIALGRHDLPPSLTVQIDTRLHPLANAEYAGAEWIPTSCTRKCETSRAGAPIEYVVVHDTEGGWNASVATLQNDPGKSVQYIVGTDGRVGQFVTEATWAWHAGNSHYNQRSVGIEHVGYSTKPYTEAAYRESAKLVDYLTTKYRIPRDRAHIIGHDQIPNGNRIDKASAACTLSPRECAKSLNYGGASVHTDPGVWEWATFMPRFGGSSKCNDVTELWACSADKKQAFRCAAGKVDVLACDGAKGCVAAADVKTDAACDVAPKAVSPAPAPAPAPVAPPDEPAPAAPPAPVAALEPIAEDGGCRAAPGSGAPPAIAPLAIAALALVRRRRR